MRALISWPFWLASFLLLVAASLLLIISFLLTNSFFPKTWLVRARFYRNITDAGVDLAFIRVDELIEERELVREEVLDPTLVEKEGIKEDLRQLFPPDWLRSQTEANLDNFYSFLRGKTVVFTPQIDFSGREEAAQTGLANLFKRKLASLPDCPAGIAGSLNNFDLFGAECVPTNLNRQLLNAKIDEATADFRPFENQTNIVVSDFDSGNLNPISRFFRIISFPPLILLALSFIFASLVFALVPEKEKKIRSQALLFIVSGATLAFIGLSLWLSSFFWLEPLRFLRQGELVLTLAKTDLIVLLEKVVRVAIFDFFLATILLGGSFFVLGLLFLRQTKSPQFEKFWAKIRYFYIFLFLLGIGSLAVLLPTFLRLASQINP